MEQEKTEIYSNYARATRRWGIRVAAHLQRFTYEDARRAVRGALVWHSGSGDDFQALDAATKRLTALLVVELPEEPAQAIDVLALAAKWVDYEDIGSVDLRGMRAERVVTEHGEQSPDQQGRAMLRLVKSVAFVALSTGTARIWCADLLALAA